MSGIERYCCLNNEERELEALRWERKALEGIICKTSEETYLKVDKLTFIDAQIAYLVNRIKERKERAKMHAEAWKGVDYGGH